MGRQPLLKRFDTYVYTNKSSTDNTQVPAIEALAEFYAQGATCADDSVLFPAGSTMDLNVYNVGSLSGTLAGPSTATVYGDVVRNVEVWLNANGTIGAKNLGADFTVHRGDRVVNSAQQLSAYLSPIGTMPKPTATELDGRLRCYIAAYRFDAVVTLSSGPRLYVDCVGSYAMR